MRAMLKRLSDRLRCAIGGHLRGKLDKTLTTQAAKVYRCKRCTSTWSRKVAKAKA